MPFDDVRFGLKLLRKEKAFALTALLTLALCTGANTAIFTLLNAVILEPPDSPEAERLVTLYNIYPGVGVTDRRGNGMRCRDSVYLALTLEYDCPFITADRRLFRGAIARYPAIRLLT